MLRKLFSIVLLLSCLLGYAQAPTATIVAPTGTICTGNAVIFDCLTANSPTVYSWSASPSNGVNFVFGASQSSIAVTFSFGGVYTISLTVGNASGTFTTSTNVTVNTNPVAMFSASLTGAGFPNQVDLTNFSTGATAYTWAYSETAMTHTTTNTSNTYTASGAYTVTLIALNTNGCSDTATYNFYLSDSSGITLPNIFTPNADGVNDIFKPIARGISTMKVNVYTRFGNFVYGWDTVNGFWDGHTTSGVACENGTYFYVIEATGFDGKSYKLKSYLTLIRH